MPLQGKFEPFLTGEQGIAIGRIKMMIRSDLVAKMAGQLADPLPPV
jgi:hypothetical protein